MKNISEHISYKEATKSVTAIRKGLENIPTTEELSKMELIAEKIFEPLREYANGPVKINSFFRSQSLNKAIGGASKNGVQTSQHCKGEAMDIDDQYKYLTNAQMFHYIKNNLNFHKLIWEFGNELNPDWVHVSYINDKKNKNESLIAYKEKGKTKYKFYA
tara:strand:+ start:28 stop:507 length:480 start_codon:yes stop_codon:yes gene_type:complete